MNIVYLGTPEFAVSTLKALHASHHNVVAVVTQTAKPSGRGKTLKPSPVKICAENLGLPVLEFKSISKQGEEVLKDLHPDVLVTCAYGQILRQNILTLAPKGVLNIHGSLLPKYRGSSPIQWTILNGEKLAGITILKSDIGIDDGPVLLKEEVPVLKNETASELFVRLSELAPKVILEALKQVEQGTAVFMPQNHEQATVCKKLTKEMKQVDFNLSAEQVKNHINGLDAGPVAETTYDGMTLKLYKASVLTEQELRHLQLNPLASYQNGQVAEAKVKRGIVVKCEDGFIKLLKLQSPGGKVLDANSYLNGKTIKVGSILR